MVLNKHRKTAYICCLLLITANCSPIVERKNSDTNESGTNKQIEKKPKTLTISIERPEPIHESFDDALTDDEAEVLFPKALKRRVGRFLFDIFDKQIGSEAGGSYMSSGDDIFSGFRNLFNLNVDTNAVMTVSILYQMYSI